MTIEECLNSINKRVSDPRNNEKYHLSKQIGGLGIYKLHKDLNHTYKNLLAEENRLEIINLENNIRRLAKNIITLMNKDNWY